MKLKDYLIKSYMQHFKEAKDDGHNAISAKKRALKATALSASKELGRAVEEKDVELAIQTALAQQRK